MMLIAVLASISMAKIPVGLWHGGDDGLTGSVSVAIEKAFKRSGRFAVNSDGSVELMVLAPTNHVRFRGRDGELRMRFEYEISRNGRLLEKGEVRCIQPNYSNCADPVLRAARRAAKR